MDYISKAVSEKKTISLSADRQQDGTISVWISLGDDREAVNIPVGINSLSSIEMLTNPHVPKLVISAAEEDQLASIFGVRLRGLINLEVLYRAVMNIDITGDDHDAKGRAETKWRLFTRITTEKSAATAFHFGNTWNEPEPAPGPFSAPGLIWEPPKKLRNDWREKNGNHLPAGRMTQDEAQLHKLASEALDCIKKSTLGLSKRSPDAVRYVNVLANSLRSTTDYHGTSYDDLPYIRKQKLLLKIVETLAESGKISIAN